jgi:hypothetical protein
MLYELIPMMPESRLRPLVERFGSSPNLVDDLIHLAAHVRTVRAFELDQTARELLGTSWKGLSTPFKEISEGVKLPHLFLTRIGQLPHGTDGAERFIKLPTTSLGVLGEEISFIAAAIEFCNAPQAIRDQFNDRSIQQITADCRKERRVHLPPLSGGGRAVLSQSGLPFR